MWSEILMMFANLPGEHKKQEAEYRAKMLCLQEHRCTSFKDRDGYWVIRVKEPAITPLQETENCLASSQPQGASECEEIKNETKENQE